MRTLLLLFLAFAGSIHAGELTAPAQARQLVVVSTSGWNENSGTLRRFERSHAHDPWRAIGPAIPVKVGRAGMAWGLGLHTNPPTGPRKIEGDRKAPAGVFHLTTAFGSDAKPAGVSLRYIRIVPGIEAVDDPASRHYTRIVDRARIAQPDWDSSEKMDTIGKEYRRGIFVAHNPKAVAGAGSCIFLHVWRHPFHATTGCTAMPLEAVADLQRWLKPGLHPVLIQAPREFLPE